MAADNFLISWAIKHCAYKAFVCKHFRVFLKGHKNVHLGQVWRVKPLGKKWSTSAVAGMGEASALLHSVSLSDILVTRQSAEWEPPISTGTL